VDTLLTIAAGNAAAATALALLVALAAPFVRSPTVRHRLWLLVPLKLLLPPLVPVTVEQPASAPPRAADIRAVETIPATVAVAGPVEVEVAALPAVPAESPSLNWQVADPALGRAAACEPPKPFPWSPILISVWLVGTAWWWALTAVRVARFRRALRCARPVPADLQTRAAELAARIGLRRCPTVWFVPAAVSPLLWALAGRPRVLLPAALWDRLGDAQRDALLLHELAHLKRGDHWVRRLELLTLGLYWWLPTAWWARRELQAVEEVCCDAWVLWAAPAAATDYALALVETVQFLAGAPPLPAAASGVGSGPGLKRRVTMILKQTPARPGSWRAALAVAVLAAVLLPWGLAQPRPAPAQDNRAAADNPAAATTAAANRVAADEPGPVTTSPSSNRVANPAPPAANRDEQIATLRDEIELLQVQLRVRQAQLQAAKAALEAAEVTAQRVDRLAQAGTISQEEILKARHEVVAARAQIAVREAELMEPQVKLRQAERRLGEWQKAKPDAGPPAFGLRAIEETQNDRSHVFHLSLLNEGGLMRLTAIRSSCGCVTADLPKDAIPPGQMADLKLTVDRTRFAGPKEITVYLTLQSARGAVSEQPLALRSTGTGALPANLATDRPKDNAPVPEILDIQKRLKDLESQRDALEKEIAVLQKRLKQQPKPPTP
jgi:beta-lactamase regulating signal transducer with metallopeptidase domain